MRLSQVGSSETNSHLIQAYHTYGQSARVHVYHVTIVNLECLVAPNDLLLFWGTFSGRFVIGLRATDYNPDYPTERSAALYKLIRVYTINL